MNKMPSSKESLLVLVVDSPLFEEELNNLFGVYCTSFMGSNARHPSARGYSVWYYNFDETNDINVSLEKCYDLLVNVDKVYLSNINIKVTILIDTDHANPINIDLELIDKIVRIDASVDVDSTSFKEFNEPIYLDEEFDDTSRFIPEDECDYSCIIAIFDCSENQYVFDFQDGCLDDDVLDFFEKKYGTYYKILALIYFKFWPGIYIEKYRFNCYNTFSIMSEKQGISWLKENGFSERLSALRLQNSMVKS